MNKQGIFDHFYDQYKAQTAEADYIYRRAALWLTANSLVGTAIAALATRGPDRRFGIDISEPTAMVVCGLSASSLALAFACMGASLFPRSYGRFSLPHEVLTWMQEYRTELDHGKYPPEFRDDAVSDVLLDELAKVLAEKTKHNAKLNELRHRMLGRSSVFTLGSVLGLMLLLCAAVVGATGNTKGVVSPSPSEAQMLNTVTTTSDQGPRPPAPPPSKPPGSGTITKGG